MIGGRHYSTYVEEIRSLKRTGDYSAAERLLLQCITAAEAESRSNSWSLAPAYYRELAIIYRKQGRFADEASLLERYEREALIHGAPSGELVERLAKVRVKLERAHRTRPSRRDSTD